MTALVRIGGIAAIAGGLLRIADSFVPADWPADVQYRLFFATDVLLLAGAAWLWWTRRATLGIAGIAGLAIFAAGILVIRFGDYALGAPMALVGLALFSGEVLLGGRGPRVAAIAWLASLGLGIAGMLVLREALTAAAGVAFGLGFVAAGLTIPPHAAGSPGPGSKTQ